ncbi:MAG TPA: hypothetical protein VJK04_04600 [Candidatus Paceibacterota bacterium]
MKNKTISWEAPEFIYHQKTVAWYWVTIFITLACFLFAVWTKNFLFAIFIVIAEILLVVWSREMPHMLEFSVTKDGVKIGKKHFYGFEELSNFSIFDTRHGSELILKRKNKISQYIKIPLNDDNIEEIQTFLLEKLMQKDYEESLPDSLFRLIKF